LLVGLKRSASSEAATSVVSTHGKPAARPQQA
jgi:hypothetical protein